MLLANTLFFSWEQRVARIPLQILETILRFKIQFGIPKGNFIGDCAMFASLSEKNYIAAVFVTFAAVPE